MNITFAVIIIAYVLIMLGVGFWSMRRTKNVGDFFLGGRTLGPWMSAFAFGTTYFSAVLFIGYAGKLGWGFGIHTMWIVIGNTIIGTLLSWWILAGRTRDMTTRLNALTMPEFLRARYNSKGLQAISALVVFVFLVPYSASVYKGLGYLFQFTLGMGYNEALFFLAALTGVYLVMGGYFAVAISDFIRGIVEFVGVMLMVYLLASRFGGFGNTTVALLGDPNIMAPGMVKPLMLGAAGLWHHPVFQMILPGAATLVCLVIITSFGPWALPQMVQKFYSIRSKADVTRAMVIAGVFSLFMAFGAYYSGAITHLFYQTGLPKAIMEPVVANGAPVVVNGIQTMAPNFDKLMPHFITNSGLPFVLVLVILLMVFSASMSSLSSLVLVSSSAISIDLFGVFRKGEVNQKATMSWMRIFCGIFVACSLVIAMKNMAVIVSLMAMSWSALAGVFMAPYLYGLFWKRTTKAGVYAGIISGLVPITVLFLGWGEPGIPIAGAISMILPMIVVPIVSLLTKPPSQEIIHAAFGTTPQEEPAWKSEATV